MTRRGLLRTSAGAGLVLALNKYAGPAIAAPAPVRGGTLRVAWFRDAYNLDPHYNTDFPGKLVIYAIYNSLLAVSPTFEIIPELAKSWTVSPDGLSITLMLQPEVKFHDGTACDAVAVKWNMDFMLDPANNSTQRAQLEPYLAGVEVGGLTSVTFHLKKPYAGFLAVLTDRPGFIVSPAAWQQYGKDLGRHPVGTGMFQFVEWLPDDHVTVKRFDGYWDRGKPYLDAINYRVVTEPTVRDTMVRTGEVDISTRPDAKDVPLLEKAPGVKVVSENPSGHVWVTQWQVDRPPFNNKTLRQAIAYGIDRAEFVKVMLGGRGTVAKGLTPPVAWWYNPGTKGVTYDPERAKKLLAQAGFPNGFQETFSTDNNSFGIQFAQLLQAQLKKINVNVTINPVETQDFVQQQLQGKINWSRQDYTLRADPDGLLRIIYYTGNYDNMMGYSNPAVDKLLDEGNATYDRNARKKIYAQLDQIVIDDVPLIYFFDSAEDTPMRSNVQNYVAIPDTIPRYSELWLSK